MRTATLKAKSMNKHAHERTSAYVHFFVQLNRAKVGNKDRICVIYRFIWIFMVLGDVHVA